MKSRHPTKTDEASVDETIASITALHKAAFPSGHNPALPSRFEISDPDIRQVEAYLRYATSSAEPMSWIRRHAINILKACTILARKIRKEHSFEQNEDILEYIKTIHSQLQALTEHKDPVWLPLKTRETSDKMITTLGGILEGRVADTGDNNYSPTHPDVPFRYRIESDKKFRQFIEDTQTPPPDKDTSHEGR